MLRRRWLNRLWDPGVSLNWQLAVFGAVHCLIFLILFHSDFYGNFYHNEVSLDYIYAFRFGRGLLPYRDFPVEYPPVAIAFISLPGIFTKIYSTYMWFFVCGVLVFDLLAIYLIAALARRMNLNSATTLAVYTICILAIGPLISVRYDLVPAVISLLAVFVFVQGRFKTAWVLLAIGVFTKVFPLIIAPLFLIYHIRHHQGPQIITGVGSFAAASAVIVLPVLLLSPTGLLDSFAYHAERGLQIETTYASALLMAHQFGLLPALKDVFNFGSYNLVSPVADFFASISYAFVVLALGGVYWLYYKTVANEPEGTPIPFLGASASASLLFYSSLAVLFFLITNKVFSAQYIIWLLPFVPLIAGRSGRIAWMLFVIVGLLTYLVYPRYYDSIIMGEFITTAMLFFRNAVLVILAVILVRDRLPGQPPALH